MHRGRVVKQQRVVIGGRFYDWHKTPGVSRAQELRFGNCRIWSGSGNHPDFLLLSHDRFFVGGDVLRLFDGPQLQSDCTKHPCSQPAPRDPNGSVKKAIPNQWLNGMGQFVKMSGTPQTTVSYRNGVEGSDTVTDKIVSVTTTVVCNPFLTIPLPCLNVPGLNGPMNFAVTSERTMRPDDQPVAPVLPTRAEGLRLRGRTMRKRSRRGQGIAEAVTAAIIIVPVALCLFDFLVVIIANSMNDTACKNAARAAANQPDLGTATQAAQTSLNSVHSPLLNGITLQNLDYQANVSVTCQTRASVHLPVPFPGYSDLIFDAQDVEPIVGATPPP